MRACKGVSSALFPLLACVARMLCNTFDVRASHSTVLPSDAKSVKILGGRMGMSGGGGREGGSDRGV